MNNFQTTLSCGCVVHSCYDEGHTGFRIEWCPLHQTAPELLEAAKIALDSLRAWNVLHCRSDEARKELAALYERSPEIQALVQAIQKAEGH